jgi:hypothetical protein
MQLATPLHAAHAGRTLFALMICCSLLTASLSRSWAAEVDDATPREESDLLELIPQDEERMVPYSYRSAYSSRAASHDDWWRKPERQHSLFLDAPIHVAAGFRFMTVDLKNNVKGEPFQDSFIGSINRLEIQDDVWAMRPYVELKARLANWLEVGVGAGWDKLVVTTLDQDTGDGDVHMQARFVYCTIALPNPSRLTPFVEIGEGNYRNSFRPLPEWYEGGKREFVLDDSTSRHIAAGCDIALYEGLSLNLYVRRSDVEVDGIYIFRGDSRDDTPFTFTLEHVAYGAGLQYAF